MGGTKKSFTQEREAEALRAYMKADLADIEMQQTFAPTQSTIVSPKQKTPTNEHNTKQ